MISGMMREVMEGLDVEETRCRRYQSASSQQLAESRHEMEQAKIDYFAADSLIEKSIDDKQKLQDEAQEISDMLSRHADMCGRMETGLRSKITRMRTDLDMASRVMTLSPCPAGGAASLIQCSHPDDEDAAAPLYALDHPGWAQMMVQLNTTTARRALQRALSHLSKKSNNATQASAKDGEDASLLQKNAGRHRWTPGVLKDYVKSYWQMKGERSRRHRGRGKHAGHRVKHAGHRKQEDYSLHRRAARCVRTAAADCGAVRNAVMAMSSDVYDKENDMRMNLAREFHMCRSFAADNRRQMTDIGLGKSKAAAALAKATAQKNTAQEVMRMKRNELFQLFHESRKSGGQCHLNVKTYNEKMCGLRKMRTELYMVEGQATAPIVTDCELADWLADECSAPCGGGTQASSRRVITQPSALGVPCPALSKTESCNEQSCPVDCQVTFWSGWSGCSSECGGGVRSRSRVVKVLALNSGAPCPDENSIAEQCNVHPCDANCELGAWSAWGMCSRACGGGFQQRSRGIKAPALGSGTCPSVDQRIGYKECNAFDCKETSGQVLQCDSKLDVVIAMDGSNDVGVDGWAKSKKFVELFIGGLGVGVDKAQVGVVVMSGPSTWDTFERCANGTAAATETECSVPVAAALSSNAATALSAVAGLVFPDKASFASGALAVADNLIHGEGRQDAESLVIVLASGRPLSETRTREAAGMLRRGARVMWVVVGGDLPPATVAQWASHPARDNVLVMSSFDDLTNTTKVSDVISAACPVLVSTDF